VSNVKNNYGLPCVVAINRFTFDTDAEINLLKEKMAAYNTKVVLAEHWAKGGAGAEELAKTVVDLIDTEKSNFKFVYDENDTLEEKMNKVVTKIYGAAGATFDPKVKANLAKWQEEGYGKFPICIAKTQYSFSTNAKALGAPSGHTVHVREARLAAGAEFVVMVSGEIMTMPGLPKVPSADKIDLDEQGNVVGLF
ncbi:MAG TPA: formate--tetrahydrofolate ligase, partial [Burkholderiales bacterium]|nr:formate--tetrahydrofolate ligase [Burkholderiales bacterium]